MKRLLVFPFLLASLGTQAAVETHSAPPLTMHQCSQAEVTAFYFYHVANASLYRQRCSHLHLSIKPPLMLVFHYNHDIPAKGFRESSVHIIKENLSKTDYARLASRIDTFNRSYRDTRKGDVYRLEYRSDGRFLLYFNDRLIATEKGDEFARDYLKIWFGKKPFSRSLKTQLLTRTGGLHG